MIIIPNFIEKYGKKKSFIICYTVLSIILITVVVILHTLQNTYNYKDHKLEIFTISESSLIMKDSNSNMLVMTLDNSGLTPVDKEYTINYLEETLKYESDFESNECIFTFSDGSQMIEPLFFTQYDSENKNDNLSDIKLREKNLIIKLTKCSVKPLDLSMGI